MLENGMQRSAGDRLDTDERLCGDLGVWGAGPLAVRLRQAPVGSARGSVCCHLCDRCCRR